MLAVRGEGEGVRGAVGRPFVGGGPAVGAVVQDHRLAVGGGAHVSRRHHRSLFAGRRIEQPDALVVLARGGDLGAVAAHRQRAPAGLPPPLHLAVLTDRDQALEVFVGHQDRSVGGDHQLGHLRALVEQLRQLELLELAAPDPGRRSVEHGAADADGDGPMLVLVAQPEALLDRLAVDGPADQLAAGAGRDQHPVSRRDRADLQHGLVAEHQRVTGRLADLERRLERLQRLRWVEPRAVLQPVPIRLVGREDVHDEPVPLRALAEEPLVVERLQGREARLEPSLDLRVEGFLLQLVGVRAFGQERLHPLEMVLAPEVERRAVERPALGCRALFRQRSKAGLRARGGTDEEGVARDVEAEGVELVVRPLAA